MLALFGALLIALYLLIGQSVRSHISASLYAFGVYGTAAVTLFFIALFKDFTLLTQTPKDWLIFFLLALFPTLLGHSVLSWALKYLKTAYISTSILFEPVFTVLFAMILFKEIPTVYEVLGGGIILIALAFYTFWQTPSTTD
jgi:drug/metabolite transporter (DMT)-like permease